MSGGYRWDRPWYTNIRPIGQLPLPSAVPQCHCAPRCLTVDTARMGAATFLNATHLDVQPGDETVCEIEVRNAGDVVDQFAVEVLGDAREWSDVEPAFVNLLPGDAATVEIAFRPPRSPDVPAGTVAFGVRVQSREDPHGSVVEEGEVEVAPFTELATELVPHKRRGRRRAKYRLVVDNTGNHETPVQIVALDPDDELQVKLNPPLLRTAAGTATVVKTKVIPHKRFLKGEPKVHEFQLMVLPEGEGECEGMEGAIAASGVMVQQQLMPTWLLPALAVLVVAAGALVALWFTLLKPTVASIAKEQTQQQVEQATSAAKQASKAADQASKAAGVAAGGGAGGGAGAGGHRSGDGTGSAGRQGGAAAGAATAHTSGGAGSRKPTTFRIQAEAPPVADGSFRSFRYVPPGKTALEITDLVLQNPRGDSGFLRLAIGKEVILVEGLANFRDLDYHYVVPLHVDPRQPVVVMVNCTAPGSGAPQCTPSVSFSGTLIKQ